MDVGASCAVNGDTLTLTGAFPTGIAAATAVSLTISQIKNPRSAKTVTGITLSTKDSNGFDIDSTSSVTLSGISTPRTFQSVSLNIVNTQQVGQSTTLQIVATLDIPVDSGAYVVLVYPSDLPLADQPITNIFSSGSYSDPSAISATGQT